MYALIYPQRTDVICNLQYCKLIFIVALYCLNIYIEILKL